MRVAVEIAVTSKPAQEVEHVAKSFRLGFDFVVLSFVHKRALERSEVLARERYTPEELLRVRFCLVTAVGKTLREIRT